eukprot:1605853-Rhodomonas_salina.6
MPCSRASLALALEPRVGVLRTKSNSNSKLLRNLGQDLNLDFGVARCPRIAGVTVPGYCGAAEFAKVPVYSSVPELSSTQLVLVPGVPPGRMDPDPLRPLPAAASVGPPAGPGGGRGTCQWRSRNLKIGVMNSSLSPASSASAAAIWGERG